MDRFVLNLSIGVYEASTENLHRKSIGFDVAKLLVEHEYLFTINSRRILVLITIFLTSDNTFGLFLAFFAFLAFLSRYLYVFGHQTLY